MFGFLGPNGAGLRALAEGGISARTDGDVLRVDLPPAEGARVTRTLADRGLYLTELRADEADLETVFRARDVG